MVKGARSLDRAQRKDSLDKTNKVSITRQCQLLNIARSTAYYCPIGISDDVLALRKIIDEIPLERPYMGSRRIRSELFKLGKYVNRKRVIRLMIAMGNGHWRRVSETADNGRR